MGNYTCLSITRLNISQYTIYPCSSGVYNVEIALRGVAAKELLEIIVFWCVHTSDEGMMRMESPFVYRGILKENGLGDIPGKVLSIDRYGFYQ